MFNNQLEVIKSCVIAFVVLIVVMGSVAFINAISLDGKHPIAIDPDFPPWVWNCGHTIVDNQTLVDRMGNWGFEDEKIQWKVLVVDKNGINKIKNVFGGMFSENGKNIQVNCIPEEILKKGQEIDDSCNAKIAEEKITTVPYDNIMRYYTCSLEIEDDNKMYGNYSLLFEADDLDGASGTNAGEEYWILNPMNAANEIPIGILGNAKLVFQSKLGDIINNHIMVKNVNKFPVRIELSTDGELKDYTEILNKSFILNPNEQKNVLFKIYVNKTGTSQGIIKVKFIHDFYGIELHATITLIVKNNSQNPEAIINYNPDSKSLIVLGNSDNIIVNKTEKCLDKKCYRKTENYFLTNSFGNNLTLAFQHNKLSSQDSFNLLSLQYNNDMAIKLVGKFSLIDTKNKLSTVFSNKTVWISIEFNKLTNKTRIIKFENRGVSNSIINGQYNVLIKTNNGSLSYEIVKKW